MSPPLPQLTTINNTGADARILVFRPIGSLPHDQDLPDKDIISSPHHREGGPDILEPDQAPDRRPFDCGLALELEAQFDEERLDGFEIVDNDEDVVHPLKRHILPSLASLLMPVLAARGVSLLINLTGAAG